MEGVGGDGGVCLYPSSYILNFGFTVLRVILALLEGNFWTALKLEVLAKTIQLLLLRNKYAEFVVSVSPAPFRRQKVQERCKNHQRGRDSSM